MDLPESEISVDPVIVTAILDRILRHSTINIKGKSEKGKGKEGRRGAIFRSTKRGKYSALMLGHFLGDH